MNLDELNPEQKLAVTTTDGPVLIIAGAGSGKTRVICHRLAYLLEQGVDPGAIFAVTFTNKAAGEMKRRVEALTGISSRSLWVSTFHSSAARILRREARLLGRTPDFVIYDEDDSKAVIKTIIRDFKLDPKEEDAGEYAEIFSRAKDDVLGPDEWLEKSRGPRSKTEKVHAIYVEYQRRLAQANAFDFGDLLVAAVHLFESAEAGARYRERFRYIMVDEYQDTNHAQYRMVRALAPGSANICVVGDDDQSIYEWRGADRGNILSFERDYPAAKVIELYRNYRSTQPILEVASTLINCNIRLREKKLRTDRVSDVRPAVVTAGSEYEEVEEILSAIRKNRRNGESLKEHAVFYRTHAQSRVVEELFSASGIAYQILNGVSFYQRAEIKDLIAYLRLIANPADDLALRRIINNPARGIGGTSLEKLAAAAAPGPIFGFLPRARELPDLRGSVLRGIDDFLEIMRVLTQAAGEVGVAELIKLMLDMTKYTDQFDDMEEDDEARVENVHEFLSAAQEFQATTSDAALPAFLERISLAADVDKFDPEKDAVVLSTLHSAKGLEFRHVFIIGCEEMLFPHPRVKADSEEGRAGLEEERRLAYVGFTRARDTLTLSHATSRRIYGRMVNNPASRFLVEAGLREPLGARFGGPVVFETKFAEADVRPAAGISFSEGDTVRHRKFGVGTVLYVQEAGDGDEIVQIRFPGGVKSLLSRYANLERA